MTNFVETNFYRFTKKKKKKKATAKSAKVNSKVNLLKVYWFLN